MRFVLNHGLFDLVRQGQNHMIIFSFLLASLFVTTSVAIKTLSTNHFMDKCNHNSSVYI